MMDDSDDLLSHLAGGANVIPPISIRFTESLRDSLSGVVTPRLNGDISSLASDRVRSLVSESLVAATGVDV
jgi:hypothetical protein